MAEPYNDESTRQNLVNLLAYAKDIHDIRSKVISDFTQKPVLSAKTGDELASHENVRIHEEAPSEAWLAIERVERTSPPQVPDACEIFLRGVKLDDTSQLPGLKSIAAERVTVEMASDLIEGGIVLEDDVMTIRNTDDSSFGYEVDVLVKIEQVPHLRHLFKQWLDNQWKPWADIERGRERQIRLYRHYFQIHQELRHRSDEFELVVVQNMVVFSSDEGATIRAPLLEHVVDIAVDEKQGYALLISPRDTPPRIVTDPFTNAMLPGSGRLRSTIQQRLDQYFSQQERIEILFDQILTEHLGTATASILHAEARYDDALDNLPEPSLTPVCTSVWMLVLKPKSTQPYNDNIASLTEQIQGTNILHLPQVGIAFGSPPSHKKLDDHGIDFNIGSAHFGQTSLRSSSAVGEPDEPTREMFFPLPYNQEQASILEQIESANAVAVQGPPGTGKSHTIANIVSHYMATGRRVLISAKTPEALAGVRSKLPPTLANLTISVLDTDSDGKKQVEDAIHFISSQIQGLNPKETLREITSLESKIQAERDRISVIETALYKHAESQLRQIKYKDEQITPAQLVKLIKKQQGEHTWFPDSLTLDDAHAPIFDENMIADARVLRQDLGESVIYTEQTLPNLGVLPGVPGLRRAHENLQQGRAIERALLRGDMPEPAENTPDFAEHMHVAAQIFDEISTIKAHLREHHNWTKLVIHMFSPVTVETEREEIVRLLGSATEWLKKVESLMVYSINIDTLPWDDPSLIEAIKRAATGQKPFGLGALFKSKAKQAFEQIQIRGQAPQNVEEWLSVQQMVESLLALKPLTATWQTLAGYIEFPYLPDTFVEKVRFLKNHRDILKMASIDYARWTIMLERLKLLYPYGVDHTAVSKMGSEFERIHDALRQWRNRRELIDAQEIPIRLREIAESGRGPVFVSLRDMANQLGTDSEASTLGDQWRSIRDEIISLSSKHQKFKQLSDITEAIRASGAPNWAAQLCSDPVKGTDDPLTPGNWRDAWDLARARGFIDSLPSRDKINALAEEQGNLEQNIQRQFERLVELRAFLGLRKGMTEKIASGLARFAAAFSKIGRNVMAKRSKRHWKEARDAMLDCYDAIPCWIIPEGRVAEQIPAKLKAFDLVIIDEASQSDITSIPVILRGEKLLVVGDDKQVSPSLVGIKEERISQLMEDHLSDHPLKHSFHPTNSLYDLVGIMSPGKRIALREHFRCVEPIIEFCSKLFYSEPLIPLRIPKTTERLDPPLIDIWVKNGHKSRDINEAEASVIIEEVEKMTENPEMARRTIGVISLIGYKQAEYISKRLFDRLGVETMERHQIECGDARFFQGQERDIIFLSMVASPGESRAQTGRDNQQRYNVAASRARDRLVLVRSVGLDDLNNPHDLKAALIEHFNRPLEILPEDRARIDLCESEFERQVFKRLMDDNYRAIPQVEAGQYRIDIVIEGQNDRRLAIELDGDQYHGPENFARDTIRQKRLERIGWAFWRCWASNWYMDPDQCYAELINTLKIMGIEPIGSDYNEAVYVRHETRGEMETSEDLLAELEAATEEQREVTEVIETVTEAENQLSTDIYHKEPIPRDTAQSTHSELDEISYEPEDIVEVGDRVTISYDDEIDKQIKITISEHHQDPGKGIIRRDEPLPKAILGAMVGEEFDIVTDHPRTGTVIFIEKRGLMATGVEPNLETVNSSV